MSAPYTQNSVEVPDQKLVSAEMIPSTVYCRRCDRLVPLSDCVVLDPEVSAGLPTDQLPEVIHTRKHRPCKGRIYLPGRAHGNLA